MKIKNTSRVLLSLALLFLILMNRNFIFMCGTVNSSQSDSTNWRAFENAYLPSCVSKVSTLGYSNEQATHICSCQLEYVKSHYKYSDVIQEGFFQRKEVVDSLDYWMETCYGSNKKDYSEEWGDLPKG